jgi:predicted Zn-dependent protease
MRESVLERFRRVAPAVDHCSLRLVHEEHDLLTVRRDVLQPVRHTVDRGAMITVHHGGGLGYGATCDLSEAGLRRAVERARAWAAFSAGRGVADFSSIAMPCTAGRWSTPVERPFTGRGLADMVGLLQDASQRLHPDERIVDWTASLWSTRSRTTLANAAGDVVEQEFELLSPDASVVASHDGEVQRRSWGGGRGASQQGGLEILDQLDFGAVVDRIPVEALQLLSAPDCPSGPMSLLLAPSQMMLQIHESIGHPLELDRILGDERNYAGTSFVTPDMFGSYRYGSELLNITFDPGVPREFAGYGFDDEGAVARREHLIRDGLLVRGLGGTTSQARSGLPGVANARAQSWNRPPIDRMANLNLEPGSATLEQLIGRVERGVFMRTNCSWSIDDSRNKFQFGCELGRVIEDGELKGLVRNPNYRGISATFWRSLSGLGDPSTLQVFGTPYCGKGEPNQIIRVGHASPVALFDDVEIFGGAS